MVKLDNVSKQYHMKRQTHVYFSNINKFFSLSDFSVTIIIYLFYSLCFRTCVNTFRCLHNHLDITTFVYDRGANEPSGSRATRDRLEKKLETSRALSSPSRA
ncbi:hypothetical protein Hanom_Chr12g01091281 [Helianthus anomalus]